MWFNSVEKHLHNHRGGGFTLLELLIAIIVLAVVLAIIYGSFSSVTATMDIARTSAERLRSQQIVWRRINNSIQGVYVDSACLQQEFQFFGESKTGPLGPADSLRFVSSQPIPGAKSLPGILKVVTCAIVDKSEISGEINELMVAEEDRRTTYLLLREEPLQLQLTDFVSQVQAPSWEIYQQAIPVASMDILYYDGVKNEWLEAWDSLEQRRLPGGIWFKINFPRTEEEREEDYHAGINLEQNPDLEIMIPLPLGRDVELPFPDFNHIRLFKDE